MFMYPWLEISIYFLLNLLFYSNDRPTTPGAVRGPYLRTAVFWPIKQKLIFEKIWFQVPKSLKIEIAYDSGRVGDTW